VVQSDLTSNLSIRTVWMSDFDRLEIKINSKFKLHHVLLLRSYYLLPAFDRPEENTNTTLTGST
jgi:hypothetical protein